MSISKHFFFLILVFLISLFESCRGYSVAPNVPNYFTKAKQLNANLGLTSIGASAQVNYSFTNKYFLRIGTLASLGTLIFPYGPKSKNINGNIGIGIYSGNLRRCYMQSSLDFFSGTFESYYQYGDSYNDLPQFEENEPSNINAGIMRTSFMFKFRKSESYFGPHLGGGIGNVRGTTSLKYDKIGSFRYNEFISEFGLMYTNQSNRNTFFNFYLNASYVGQNWVGVFASASWTFKIVK
jgi:hypothetical protein